MGSKTCIYLQKIFLKSDKECHVQCARLYSTLLIQHSQLNQKFPKIVDTDFVEKCQDINCQQFLYFNGKASSCSQLLSVAASCILMIVSGAVQKHRLALNALYLHAQNNPALGVKSGHWCLNGRKSRRSVFSKVLGLGLFFFNLSKR